MDDGQIVTLYLQRDEAAIRRTTERYGRRLYALALGITADAQTAEECENDTYLQAWNTIPPHEPRGYLYAFLARITRHISLNRCRDRARLCRRAQRWMRSWSSASPRRTTPPAGWRSGRCRRRSTAFWPR